MIIHLIQQGCKDIVQSTLASARHDDWMTQGAQQKYKDVQNTQNQLTKGVSPMTAGANRTTRGCTLWTLENLHFSRGPNTGDM